jgi:ankyrin repeat protein
LTHPKIDVAVEDREGNTLLHRAAKHHNLTAIGLLLAKKTVDVNTVNHQGQTPLHLAACRFKATKMVVVNKLLRHPKINIFIQDQFGQTALDEAINAEKEEIAYALFTHPQMTRNAQIKTLRYAKKQNKQQVAKALLSTLDEQQRAAVLAQTNGSNLTDHAEQILSLIRKSLVKLASQLASLLSYLSGFISPKACHKTD